MEKTGLEMLLEIQFLIPITFFLPTYQAKKTSSSTFLKNNFLVTKMVHLNPTIILETIGQ